MTLEEKKKQAEALGKANDYEGAIRLWDEIVKESPDANSWWKYGLALTNAKQEEAAVKAYLEAVKLAPSSPAAWGSLAGAYKKTGKVAEAEKAATQAIHFDPTYLYAYRLIYEIHSDSKNWAGQVEILSRLVRNGAATDYDLNCLGIAHANLKQHGEAIRFYKLAAKSKPTVYPYYNLGLIYDQVGQTLDAFDSFQASLRIDPSYEPAKKSRLKIQQTLLDFQNKFGNVTPIIPQDEWYRYYINPFELLGAERSGKLADYDAKTLVGLKKRLLHSIALEEGKVALPSGQTIDASMVENSYKDLLDETKREHHWIVFQDEKLLRFLTCSDLRIFLYGTGETPFPLMDKISLDADFRVWLSDIFSKQYNHVLGTALKVGAITAVEALLDGRRWTEPEHDDVSFERAHRHIAEMIEPLGRMRQRSKTEPPNLGEIQKAAIGDAQKQENLSILRKLPLQFRDQLSELLASIRVVAVDCHNVHKQTALAREILRVAQLFRIRDVKLSELLAEDIAALDSILKEEESHKFEALVRKGLTSRLSKKGIEYGGKFIPAADVRALSWGVYILRVNGVKTQHNFALNVTGTSNFISISWDASGWMVGLVKKMLRKKDAPLPICDLPTDQQEAYFGKIVDAVFHTTGSYLINYLTAEFAAGRTVKVGGCTLSKQGAAFRTGFIFKNDNQVPWSELETESAGGQIILKHKSVKATRIALSAKLIPNAVILPTLCRLMKNKSQ